MTGPVPQREEALQSLGIATRVIAASLALAAFAVAIVSGLAAGNPARIVLLNAVVCMIVCQILGLFVGVLAERAVSEHVADYKSARPVPGGPPPRATGNSQNQSPG
jgi:tetrahydromethanopterin S-methyltransferase subunit C